MPFLWHWAFTVLQTLFNRQYFSMEKVVGNAGRLLSGPLCNPEEMKIQPDGLMYREVETLN